METIQEIRPVVINDGNNTITKPVRRLRKRTAVRVKPPQFEPADGLSADLGEGRYVFVYVDAGGNEHRVTCTKEVWRKAHGFDDPESDIVQSKGYRNKINFNFLLGFELGEDGRTVLPVLTSVDLVNMQPVAGPVKMDAAERRTTISVKFDAFSGEMEVSGYPSRVSGNEATALVNLLDTVGELRVGREAANGYKVQSIDGMTVEILPPVKGAAAVQR